METLSKELQGNHEEDNHASTIDYGTWKFKLSEEDEKRKVRQNWHKQQVIMLASKVNRNAVNEMLLKD